MNRIFKRRHHAWLMQVALLCALTMVAEGRHVTVTLGPAGQTVAPAADIRGGDLITVAAPGMVVAYRRDFTSVPEISAATVACPTTSAPDLQTHAGDVAVVYVLCQAGATPGAPPVTKRVGIFLLGPHRKTAYLAYSNVPSSPNTAVVHLEPIGNPPVLTTADEPFLVVVNKKTDSMPTVLDLSYTVADGEFIDVAPVRPSISPGVVAPAVAGLAVPTPPPPYYLDYVLPFHKTFLGEKVVSYEISGYYEAETENKQTVSNDGTGPMLSSSVITEKAAHKIYSGELPQIHSLYYYNLTSGVMASWLRDPSFTKVKTKLAAGETSPAQYKTEEQRGSARAFPVLMFSSYLKPRDIQIPWTWKELAPAPTVGFSLSSPTTDFFFGGSSEIQRNVQFFYGYHFGKVTKLGNATQIDDPTSDTAPATVQRFTGAFAMGLSFNLDFIKGLFK